MAHNKLILIADDEIGIHESLRIYLSRDGYDTCSVYNGSDVMDIFTRLRPDLVILDIMMPGRSGTQVCTDIRAVSMTPIIILLPSYWLFKQKITWRAVLGAVISVVGVSLFFLT